MEPPRTPRTPRRASRAHNPIGRVGIIWRAIGAPLASLANLVVVFRGLTEASRRPPMKPIVLVVAAALVDSDGRVLIGQRPKGKQLEGLWEFPGGKVDEGETPEIALIRELEEE